MRRRILNPGFFDNEELGALEPFARILFAGLWCYADREGRFKWQPTLIHSKIFPWDDTGCDTAILLESLRVSSLVVRYNVNGNEYGWIPTFLDYQTPHRREMASKIPAYEEGEPRADPGTDPGQSRDSPGTDQGHAVFVPVSVPVLKLHSSSSIEAAELLKGLLLREQPKAKIPKEIIEAKRSWASEIDRMIRIDNRDPPEILKMIQWLYTKNLENEIQFVVKSAKSLRTKYDRIETQMKKHQPRRVEDPHKDRECKGQCKSWWSTMEVDERGWCENCQRDETLSPD